VAPGTTIVIATNNDSAYQTARDLAAAGSTVIVADGRTGAAAADAARAAGLDVRLGHHLRGTRGVPVHTAIIEGPAGRVAIACDLVVTSAGWTPTVHLTSHLGIKPRYDDRSAAFVPGGYAEGHFGAGALTG